MKLKTFTRMIGRYVLATAAVVLLVVGLLLIAAFFGLGCLFVGISRLL